MSGFVATIAEVGVDRRFTEMANRNLLCKDIGDISDNNKHMLQIIRSLLNSLKTLFP